jgi:signal transduction histidine kinase
MLNLLNDILDISKNKHLSHELASNKVIFQNLAFEAIDGMKSLAQSKSIRLKSSIVPYESKHVIVTDRTKVIQIVSNTVNNAIKFTGQGGIDVKFELVKTVKDCANLVIADTCKPYDAMTFMRKEGELMRKEKEILEYIAPIKDTETMRWMYFAVKDYGCGMVRIG